MGKRTVDNKHFYGLFFSVVIIVLGAVFYVDNLTEQELLQSELYLNEQKINRLSDLNALVIKAAYTEPADEKTTERQLKQLDERFFADSLEAAVTEMLTIARNILVPEASKLQAPADMRLSNLQQWSNLYKPLQKTLEQRSHLLVKKSHTISQHNTTWFFILLLLVIGLLIWAFVTFKNRAYLNYKLELAQKVNEAVVESKREFTAAFENASIGMALVDLTGKWLRVNHSLCELLGYSEAELKTTGFQALTHPDDLASDLHFLKQLLDGTIHKYTIEKRYITKDDRVLWASLSVSIVKNGDGSPRYFISQIENINERKLVQLALEESELKYRSFFENSLHGKLVLQGNGRFLEVNEAALRMFGYPKPEFLQLNPRELGDYDESFAQNIRREIRKTGKLQLELQGVRKTGQRFPLLISAVLYRSKEGADLISIAAVDVSAQKAAQEELRLQKERLSNVLQGTNAGTWEWNVETGETVYNDVWAEMLGYQLQDLCPVGKETWLSLIHPDDIAASNKKLQAVFNHEVDFYECECRMRHKDGHYVWILDRGKVASWTSEGKPLWMFGTHLDISTSKMLEEELRTQKAFTDAVLETISVGIVVCDKDGKLTMFNRATRDMHGLPVTEIDASDWGQYYQLYESDRVTPLVTERIPLHRAWKGHTDAAREMAIRHASGQMIDVLSTGTQIVDEAGSMIGAVVAMTDVSAIKQIQQELEQKNQELEDFASVAAHDLKEPLRMIGNFMSLLQTKYQQQLDPTALKYIQFAVTGASRMSQLITDLLDFAMVGSKKTEKETFELETVLLEIVSLNASYIADKEAEVNWDPMPVLHAQKTPIQLLFQNLIVNGIKYQQDGQVPKVVIRVQELEEEWLFEITDNGIGIDQIYHESVFKVFSRLHSRDKYGGTGMGLATCKKIVEQHGGKIWLQSSPGAGTSFFFTLSKIG